VTIRCPPKRVNSKSSNKVHAPDLVDLAGLRLRLAQLHCFVAPWAFVAQTQPHLAVEPIDAFVVVFEALTSQEHVYTSVAVVHPGLRDLTDATGEQLAVLGY
jgi:hypothetical protein